MTLSDSEHLLKLSPNTASRRIWSPAAKSADNRVLDHYPPFRLQSFVNLKRSCLESRFFAISLGSWNPDGGDWPVPTPDPDREPV
jgi:hypothetical protein